MHQIKTKSDHPGHSPCLISRDFGHNGKEGDVSENMYEPCKEKTWVKGF